MANSDIINKIVSSYKSLTNAERKVADVVLSNPHRVLNGTITDLAEMCGVGDTSVFRFCRSLKLNGYQDFKVSLALSINSENMLDEKKIDDVFESENIEGLCRSIYTTYMDSLDDTLNSLNFDAINKAVDLLINAETIHFFGFGGSGITALEAQNKFLKITPNVSYNTDSHMQMTTATLLGENAIAVIFSNSGITKDCIEIAKLAKNSNASTIFITKFAKTPATKYADVLLLSGANEGPMQGGSIAAKTSQMFMVDILFTEYFHRKGDLSIENKKYTAAAIAGKML
jgi:DNA-binding MurR/RpiR family transcriptional regulator